VPQRTSPQPTSPNNHAGLIWTIADLLRGDYERAEYQKVILPLVLLRRLDCVLEPTKSQVLARVKPKEDAGRPACALPSSRRRTVGFAPPGH
jgi:type I restriction-modification system DNA methylase subunit